jgi:citrate lyase beta subunit
MKVVHRTMLYVPAADPAKMAKAKELSARATVILDLEDSVAAQRKQWARDSAGSFLANSEPGSAFWVRVNSGSDDLYRDLDSVVLPGLRGLILPKSEDPGMVLLVDRTVGRLESERQMVHGEVALAPTIESAAGLIGLSAIAKSSKRIDWLGFGSMDFCADLGIGTPREGPANPTLTHARVSIVIASRAAGLSRPHDGAHVYFKDQAGLRAMAESARSLGFGTKHAIHPDQIAVLDEVFGLAETDLEHARLILKAFERARAEGRANAELDGELIDLATARNAQRLLEESE